MTGSWTIDAFIIGCVLLILIPFVIWFYKEVYKKKSGDAK